MLSPYLYFKDNVLLIEQGNAKPSSSIVAAINGNTTSPARGKSIILNYRNRFHSGMAIFHGNLPEHFQITAVSVRMLVIQPLMLSNLFKRRNFMSVAGLVQKMSVTLLFVFVTLIFVITVALWHLIIIIST